MYKNQDQDTENNRNTNNSSMDVNSILNRKEITIRDVLRILVFISDEFALSVSSSAIDEFEDKFDGVGELTEEDLRAFLNFIEIVFSGVDAVSRVVEKIKAVLKNN